MYNYKLQRLSECVHSERWLKMERKNFCTHRVDMPPKTAQRMKSTNCLGSKSCCSVQKKKKRFQKKEKTFNMWKKLPTFLRSLSHDKFLNNFCMLSTCCRRHHTWKVRMRSGFKLKSLITSRDKHARLFIREKDAGVCTEARQWRQGAKLSYELPNRSSSSTWRVLLPSHKSCKETSVQKKRPTKSFLSSSMSALWEIICKRRCVCM